MHLCVFFGAVIFFEWTDHVPLLGDTKESLISSYLYHEVQKSTVKSVAQAVTPEKAIRVSKLKKSTHQQKSPSTVNSHQTGEQTKSLLALLHAAIQQKQQYPSSAIEMERQGKSTVKFVLYPNGKITNLQLVQSSGVESLDSAALTAVQDAAPFHEIDVYLKSAQEFSIDVVFELA